MIRLKSTLCISLIIIFAGIFPVTACATPESPPTTMLTIGVVNLSPQLEPVLEGFKNGMLSLGYTEGDQIEYLYDGPAPDLAALDTIAETFVNSDVDLILAISTPATQAAFRATQNTNIPVVFGPVTDPIAAGVITKLSHPGGNVTGVMLGGQSEGQRLQWLTQLAPETHWIYVPYNPDDASAIASVDGVIQAAGELGVELLLREARNADEISDAIASIPAKAQAVFLPQDSLVAARIDDFVTATLDLELPLCVPTDGQVERGALLSYSFQLIALGEQQARLADQIFRGIKPVDLPVETAEFFLTVNLKTADAINLTIPDEVLRTVDRVIR